MALLTLKKLCLKYGEQIIVSDASFSLEDGDFACVVGTNGSGKSTLVKAILGLIKPASGEVVYGDGLAQTQIGYLPQETRVDGNFPATAEEIVLSGCLGHMGIKPFYCHHEKKHALECLSALGIGKLAKKSFSDLSGGQKQKVLLARSLAATKKLLILDEPSNNLDYKSRKDFYSTLKKLNENRKLTIIMITHDLDADDLIGDKVIAIKEGKVSVADTAKYLGAYK